MFGVFAYTLICGIEGLSKRSPAGALVGLLGARDLLLNEQDLKKTNNTNNLYYTTLHYTILYTTTT